MLYLLLFLPMCSLRALLSKMTENFAYLGADSYDLMIKATLSRFRCSESLFGLLNVKGCVCKSLRLRAVLANQESC